MDIEHIDTVSERGDGLLLHDYLRGCWPFLNPQCWQQLISDSSLEIDGRSLAQSGQYNPPLKRGQALHYWLKNYQEDPVDCNWKLLWDAAKPNQSRGQSGQSGTGIDSLIGDRHKKLSAKQSGKQSGTGTINSGQATAESSPANTEIYRAASVADDFIAVHKPANLPVSRTTRNFYNTLIRLVREQSGTGTINSGQAAAESSPADTEINRAASVADDIIAVHKPANLPVSRTTRNFYNTLIRLVRRESEWPDAHLLHRLDLDTAGIILLGKNKAAASYWQPKLHQLLQRKVYQAVVYGKPDWEQTELECRLATRPEHSIRCQMHVCADTEKGKLSRTGFKLLRSSGDYSIIECELFTGRKHQIRAHLAHLGHPIVGDKIYSNSGDFYLKRLNDEDTPSDHTKLMTEHHLLMAQRVELNPHPSPSQPPAPIVTIINPHYPPVWIEFCRRVGLLE